MANECLACFSSVLQRMCRSRTYAFQLLSALLMGLAGVPLLWTLREFAGSLPSSAMQMFWTGRNYQLGFLAVSDWKAGMDGCCDEIIRGVFSGTLAAVSVVFHIVHFFGSEYRGAYLQLWLMRGQSRRSLFVLYELGIIVSALPVILLFQAGTWCSLAIVGVTGIRSADAVFAVVLAQLFMLLCLCFCSVAAALNLRQTNGGLILFGAVLCAPAVSSYLLLLTKGSRFSNGVLLLTRLTNSGALTAADIPETLAVSILTAAFCGAFGYIVFCQKRIG